MSVIFTNSLAAINKLCLLCVRSQEFNSRGITTWTVKKKKKGETHDKNNRVTLVTTGYKTSSRQQ